VSPDSRFALQILFQSRQTLVMEVVLATILPAVALPANVLVVLPDDVYVPAVDVLYSQEFFSSLVILVL